MKTEAEAGEGSRTSSYLLPLLPSFHPPSLSAFFLPSVSSTEYLGMYHVPSGNAKLEAKTNPQVVQAPGSEKEGLPLGLGCPSWGAPKTASPPRVSPRSPGACWIFSPSLIISPAGLTLTCHKNLLAEVVFRSSEHGEARPGLSLVTFPVHQWRALDGTGPDAERQEEFQV